MSYKAYLGGAAVALLASVSGAQAVGLAAGDSVNVDMLVNGAFDDSFSGVVGAGSDIAMYGWSLFLNEGPQGADFQFTSAGTYCGWYCGGETIDIVVSDLDFGEPFAIENASSLFPVTFTVLSDTSFKVTWMNDGFGTPTPAGQTFISGSFASQPSAVPLPAALPLLAAGMGGLSVLGLRRSGRSREALERKAG